MKATVYDVDYQQEYNAFTHMSAGQERKEKLRDNNQ